MCVVRGCNVGRLRFLFVFSFQTWEGVLRWLAGISTIFRCMSFGKLGFLVRQGISWFSFSFLTSNTWVGANLYSDVGTKYPTLPHEFNYPTTRKQHPRAVFSKKRSFITCWKFKHFPVQPWYVWVANGTIEIEPFWGKNGYKSVAC